MYNKELFPMRNYDIIKTPLSEKMSIFKRLS